ncbi:MAG: site-specific integrase [Telluria sp.]
MASIEETATGYRVHVCKLGVRDTATFGRGEKVKAKQWGTTREAEIIAGKKLAKSDKGYTVKQLIEEFMKLDKRSDWDRSRCKWFLQNLSFVGMHLRALEQEDIEEWMRERSNVVAGDSINRDLALLGPIFTYGVKRKWLDKNLAHGIEREANGEPRNMRISDEDADAIIEALGYVRGTSPVSARDRVAWAFLMALETGLRRGEILKTVWKHVHMDHIHLPSAITKNRTKRDVPFNSRARALVDLLDRSHDTLLGSISADTVDRLFREARMKTPLKDLHFHDTRHEAVTRLARKLDILDLSVMIGHKDINSLRIYYNPTPGEISSRLD